MGLVRTWGPKPYTSSRTSSGSVSLDPPGTRAPVPPNERTDRCSCTGPSTFQLNTPCLLGCPIQTRQDLCARPGRMDDKTVPWQGTDLDHPVLIAWQVWPVPWRSIPISVWVWAILPCYVEGLRGTVRQTVRKMCVVPIPDTPCMPYMPTLGWFGGSM